MRADVPTNVPAERKGADFRFAQGFKPALPGSCVKAVCAPLRTRHEPKAKARVSFVHVTKRKELIIFIITLGLKVG